MKQSSFETRDAASGVFEICFASDPQIENARTT